MTAHESPAARAAATAAARAACVALLVIAARIRRKWVASRTSAGSISIESSHSLISSAVGSGT